MIPKHLRTAVLLLALLVFSQGVFAENLKSLFDGKTLNGWNERGEGIWEIKDGTILGRTGKGGHGWLCANKTYGDFILELEVKIESGNSGIQIRSHFEEKEKMVGYQIEVDPSKRAWSGGLYEQGRRAWLQNLTNNEPARAAFKVGEWNKYRIVCVGDSIKSWVNGVPATDYVDSMDIEGTIALQVHAGKNALVQYRNLSLQDLGKRKWLPLWDGKTLAGWHKIGQGDWEIDDGSIVGKHETSQTEYGHLVSDKVFKNFTTRLKFKTVSGNSGFYFRSEEKGASGISGLHAEIDPTNNIGGVYETNGRSWVSTTIPAQIKKFFKPGEWNTMTVSAHDKRIVINVNGYKTAELKDDSSRTEGRFALQLHGHQDVEVHFKDIEILGEPEMVP